MVNSKNAFWMALVFTLIIFVIGFMIGLFFEGVRESKLESVLANSELNLLDEQLRERVVVNTEVGCGLAVENLFEFADRIYWEALNLEEYGKAEIFGDGLLLIHRRYDLLRMMVWIDSLELKLRCGNDFNTLVYFYEYDPEEKDLDMKSKKIALSRALEEVKKDYAGKVLLVPIAVNLDSVSINLALESYGVSEFPSVLVNEKQVLGWESTVEEIESYLEK